MSEPLSAEGVDEYERHGLYGRWVGTIRDRERQVGQAWEAMEREVDENRFYVEAFDALYEDLEAERERIGQVWECAEKMTELFYHWRNVANYHMEDSVEAEEEVVAQAKRIADLEAAVRRVLPHIRNRDIQERFRADTGIEWDTLQPEEGEDDERRSS